MTPHLCALSSRSGRRGIESGQAQLVFNAMLAEGILIMLIIKQKVEQTKWFF